MMFSAAECMAGTLRLEELTRPALSRNPPFVTTGTTVVCYYPPISVLGFIDVGAAPRVGLLTVAIYFYDTLLIGAFWISSFIETG